MTKYTEEKIASYSQKGTRIQLLRIIDSEYRVRYQVRLNRKVQKSSMFEYEMRKLFAMLVQNTVLQLKMFDDNTTPVEKPKNLKISMGGKYYKGEIIDKTTYNNILNREPGIKAPYPIARIDEYPCKLIEIQYSQYLAIK